MTPPAWLEEMDRLRTEIRHIIEMIDKNMNAGTACTLCFRALQRLKKLLDN